MKANVFNRDRTQVQITTPASLNPNAESLVDDFTREYSGLVNVHEFLATNP